MKQFSPAPGNNRPSKSGNQLALQAFAIIAVAVVGSIWYFNNQNQLSPNRNGRVTTQRKVLTSAVTTNPSPNEQVQVSTLNEGQKNSLAGVETQSSTDSSAPRNGATATASPAPESAPKPEVRTAGTVPPQAAVNNSALFTLNYYEVPKALVDFWIQQNVAEHPEYNQTGASYGVLSKEELQKLSQARLLLSEKRKLNPGQNSQLVHRSSSYQNPQENPSLTVNISYSGLESNLANLEFEALKRLPAPEKLPMVKINVPKNSAAFILWRNLVNGFQNHSELLQTPPFNFITSPKANSRETELVLVVETYF